MAHEDYTVYLGHMLDAARWVERRVAGVSRAEFDQNIDMQFAVAHLQIIGEAARKVDETDRNVLPQIPWRQITGMRHRIVHDYTRLNLNIVWKTSTEDIAPLIAELSKIVS